MVVVVVKVVSGGGGWRCVSVVRQWVQVVVMAMAVEVGPLSSTTLPLLLTLKGGMVKVPAGTFQDGGGGDGVCVCGGGV